MTSTVNLKNAASSLTSERQKGGMGGCWGEMSHRRLLGGTESRSRERSSACALTGQAPKRNGSELEHSAVAAGETEAPLPQGRPLSAPQCLLEEALPIFVSSSLLVNLL